MKYEYKVTTSVISYERGNLYPEVEVNKPDDSWELVSSCIQDGIIFWTWKRVIE